MIRAVVFDIGGVLEYTPDLQVRERWEPRLGLAPGELGRRLTTVWVEGSYGRISEAEVLTRMMGLLEIDHATADALMANLWEEYLGTTNEELLTYFRGLRGRCPTAILSNSFVGARERETPRLGLTDLCDIVIYSHEVGLCKPEPEIYELTCQRLGLSPSHVAFVDDHDDCLQGARDVGLYAIPFTDNATAIQAIEAWLTG